MRSPNILSIMKNDDRKKRQYCQMQEKKKTEMFKLQPKLAWRQLKGKKEDVIGDFTNKAIEHMFRSFICIL